jgi:release factor glutamine methyltransferase
MDFVGLYLDLLQQLSKNLSILPDKPRETPESTLRSLWFLASGKPASAENSLLASLPNLTTEEIYCLRQLIEHRINGLPLAHLTRRASFMGIEMIVGAEALIPRYETEILGFAALKILKELVQERGQVTIIDLCTGSGNLALAMACHEENCIVYGSDISSKAIELANENAKHLGIADRVNFMVGNLFEPFENDQFTGKVDMILCNPPYISTARIESMPAEIVAYEPKEAFDGGPFGVSVLMTLIQKGPTILKANSWLGFEVGWGQGKAMKSRVERSGRFKEVHEYYDKDGQIRALFGLSLD